MCGVMYFIIRKIYPSILTVLNGDVLPFLYIYSFTSFLSVYTDVNDKYIEPTTHVHINNTPIIKLAKLIFGRNSIEMNENIILNTPTTPIVKICSAVTILFPFLVNSIISHHIIHPVIIPICPLGIIQMNTGE
jgi:hypothetical protein